MQCNRNDCQWNKENSNNSGHEVYWWCHGGHHHGCSSSFDINLLRNRLKCRGPTSQGSTIDVVRGGHWDTPNVCKIDNWLAQTNLLMLLIPLSQRKIIWTNVTPILRSATKTQQMTVALWKTYSSVGCELIKVYTWCESEKWHHGLLSF